MSIYMVDGHFVDDGLPFTGYLIKDTNDVGEDDENIFYYGITPQVGKQYDDFIITKVEKLQ